MTIQKLMTTAATATLIAAATTAAADDKTSVAVFYELLSNPGSSELAEDFKDVTLENWESIGNYTGDNKTRDAFLGQMGGFAQLMPDLDWAVQAMHQDGNVITVRSRASGVRRSCAMLSETRRTSSRSCSMRSSIALRFFPTSSLP